MPLRTSAGRITEALTIRAQLKLRKVPKDNDEWEVYTTIHGTGVFRWFKITRECKDWYKRRFPEIPIVPHEDAPQGKGNQHD